MSVADRPRVPVAMRVPLLAAGGVALLAGLYAGLILLGVCDPPPATAVEDAHGPAMVFGFVGTLVALERAVALGARWALLAPACAASGALALLAGAPPMVGRLLLAAGGAALLLCYAALWRRQPALAVLIQAGGALSWYAVSMLWLGGFGVAETVPWLAAFVLLTIGGERLELAHVGLRSDARSTTGGWFVVAAAMLAAAAATTLWPDAGHRLWGLAVLGFAGWLSTVDVARRTVRARGLPRYVALGLLTGYAWLAVAGMVWTGAGMMTDGPGYDAVLHAVFLGFTMSMIFAHAPVILPAILRRPLPFHRVLYVPLALLHLSLLVRLGLGDLAGLGTLWRWAGVLNEVAVLSFVAAAAALVLRARRVRRTVTGPPAVAVASR